MTDNVRPIAGFINQAYADRSRKFMESDLIRSGLTPEDIEVSPDATPRVVNGAQDLTASYTITYYTAGGNPLPLQTMARTRLKYNLSEGQIKNRGLSKYTQPSRAAAGDLACAIYMPPVKRRGKELMLCEGEKKVVAAMKRFKIPGIAMGGKDNWMIDGHLHDDLVTCIGECSKLNIIPDGDINKPQVGRSYRLLAEEIKARFPKLDIEIICMPDGQSIDDYLVANPKFVIHDFWEIEPIDMYALYMTEPELIDRYGLVYKNVGPLERQAKKLRAIEANVSKLMLSHPYFKGRLWFNEEHNYAVMDDEPDRKGIGVTDLMEEFQDNFFMDGLTHSKMTNSYAKVAHRNRRRPIREYLLGLKDKRLKENMLPHLFGKWAGNKSELDSYNHLVGKHFLCGLVGRIIDPGMPMRGALVLEGPQGVGKTGFAQWWALGGRDALVFNMHRGYLRTMTKDMEQGLATADIVLWDDLDLVTDLNYSALRGLMTQTKHALRVPYGKDLESFDVHNIWIFTTNSHEYLHDDRTGNTRFLPVQFCKDDMIYDFEAMTKHKEVLLAAAVQQYLDGGWELSPDEFPSEWEDKISSGPYHSRVERFTDRVHNELVHKHGMDKIDHPHIMTSVNNKTIVVNLLNRELMHVYGEDLLEYLGEQGNTGKYKELATALRRCGWYKWNEGHKSKYKRVGGVNFSGWFHPWAK